MKVCVVLSVVVLVAVVQATSLTPEQSAKLREYYKTCIESSHVNEELVTKARGGEFADDEHLDDFFTCMFKHSGLIDDDGHLKGDVIKSKVPSDVSSEDMEKVLTACAKVQSSPKEKVAKLAYKCYLTETPVKIHLIDP